MTNYPSKAAAYRNTGSALDRATQSGLAGSSFQRPASFYPRSQPAAQAMPASPGGRLVPGRSGGSMVWQANTPSEPTAAPLTPPASQTSSNPLDAPSLPALGSPLNGNGGSGRSPLDAPSLPALGSPLNSNGGSGRSPLDAPGLPQLEFGGAFAEGGIAPAGKVSLVGERGPEWIVPSGPTAVVPMRAAPLVNTGSAMDRHMSTGLSGQPTRAVGRSMNDPQRMQEIALRRLRSQGDYAGATKLAQSQAWLDARFLGRTPQPMMPAGPATPAGATPMPMPQQPGGQLMPGRSAGSMVWQSNTPPVPAEAPSMSPMPVMPLPAPAPMPTMSSPAAPMASVTPEFNMGGQSPLNGPQLPALTDAPMGSYPGAPPMVSSIAIPGTDSLLPVLGGQIKGSPLPRAQTPKPDAPKIPEGIQYEKDAMGKIIGGVYPTYNDQGKLVMRRIDLDGDGVIDPAEQAAAMQAAGQTPGGVKFSRVQ